MQFKSIKRDCNSIKAGHPTHRRNSKIHKQEKHISKTRKNAKKCFLTSCDLNTLLIQPEKQVSSGNRKIQITGTTNCKLYWLINLNGSSEEASGGTYTCWGPVEVHCCFLCFGSEGKSRKSPQMAHNPSSVKSRSSGCHWLTVARRSSGQTVLSLGSLSDHHLHSGRTTRLRNVCPITRAKPRVFLGGKTVKNLSHILSPVTSHVDLQVCNVMKLFPTGCTQMWSLTCVKSHVDIYCPLLFKSLPT